MFGCEECQHNTDNISNTEKTERVKQIVQTTLPIRDPFLEELKEKLRKDNMGLHPITAKENESISVHTL